MIQDNNVYKGSVLNDVPHGPGIRIHREPEKNMTIQYEAIWINGKQTGECIMIQTDEDTKVSTVWKCMNEVPTDVLEKFNQNEIIQK